MKLCSGLLEIIGLIKRIENKSSGAAANCVQGVVRAAFHISSPFSQMAFQSLCRKQPLWQPCHSSCLYRYGSIKACHFSQRSNAYRVVCPPPRLCSKNACIFKVNLVLLRVFGFHAMGVVFLERKLETSVYPITQGFWLMNGSTILRKHQRSTSRMSKLRSQNGSPKST